MSRTKFCKKCNKITKYKFDDLGETYCTQCGEMHYNWLSGNKKWVVIALIVIALIFSIKTIIPEPNPNPNNFSNQIISCLDNQYTMYGTEWCAHCRNQKNTLGKVIVDVSYIDCDKNMAQCEGKGITGYPFNVMFHKDTEELSTIAGEIEVSKILKLTGCGVK